MQRSTESGGSTPGPDRTWLHRVQGPLYACFAGVWVLLAARLFYSSLKLQIFYSSVRRDPYLSVNDWSAPLDDVFIHFDFARSAARGHPFEWSAGNGYSSGGTSLLYPFVLAPGFWLGFRGERLMHFAALVACTSVFLALLGCRRLFRTLPRFTEYLAPPALLAVGALDWSLFSGMEVAFFLAVWSVALVVWDDLVNGSPDAAFGPRALPSWPGALGLGLVNAVLVATRPEAAVVVVVFGVSAALAVAKREDARAGWATLALSGVFAALVIAGQAVANRLFTGDFSAAGALVKLELNNPRLTAREVFDLWVFHVRYQIGRVTGYHVASGLAWGWLLWALAALPLVFKKTRLQGVVLWLQAVLWVLVVALNGQVRWQNERYTMPAVAWMLLSAALGVGAACTHDWKLRRHPTAYRLVTTLGVSAVVLVLGWQQISRMRGQAWFFGRASRNIRDQHILVGRRIRKEIPSARRVLVGDAGAIPYASDLPALDIIGLGGYPGLPFAEASRWGVAAAVELIQRMPSRERPDVMAIYPGWWSEFPMWFGLPLDGVSVRGNVICGGLTKMIYAAHWEALDGGDAPATALEDGEESVDELDFADVMSEREHGYRITGAPGLVTMKLLERPGANGPVRGESPRDPRSRLLGVEATPGAAPDHDSEEPAPPPAELWDAGRALPPSASLSFSLGGFVPGAPVRLMIRTAPAQAARLRVRVDGWDLEPLVLQAVDTWHEAVVLVPGARVGAKLWVTISAERNEVVLHHLWGLQRR
jgi:hypothetical protein